MLNHQYAIVVLISGEGSNLQAIIDAIASGQIPAQIKVVISNKKNANGLQRAQKAGIKTEVISNKTYPSREEYDAELLKRIHQYQPDLLVLAGFMRILTADFVKHFQGKIINIHPALLPKYRGLHTHKKVLQAGDAEHGASVHFVTEDLDSGPIIAQSKLKTLPNDTSKTLQKRVLSLEHQLYPLVIQWLAENRLHLTNEGILLDGKALAKTGLEVDLKFPPKGIIID